MTGKSMVDLQTAGKTTTTLSAADLLLATINPATVPDNKVITWSDVKALIQALTDTLYQPIGIINTRYIITPSVSSNNLTVAIKYIDAADASSSHPVKFRVGNTEYSLTASVSFTKNAGTNWCNAGGTELAAKDVDYFVYAIGETGASAGLKFGFSRIPYAVTMADFVNTSTNEKYIAGNWTNFTSTDAVTLIGRFRAQLSATASFNWSIPTAKVINRPIFDTDWLTWAPVWITTNLAGTTGTFSSFSGTTKYRIIGQKCEVELQGSGTLGGSACTYIAGTVPFEAAQSALNITAGPLLFADGSATSGAFGGIFINGATPDKICLNKYNNANWHTSGGATIDAVGMYEI